MHTISRRITSFPHLYLPEPDYGYLGELVAARSASRKRSPSRLGALIRKLDIGRWWKRTRFHFDLDLLQSFEISQADIDRDLLHGRDDD